MYSAYVAPEELAFPDWCLRCSARAPRDAYMMRYGAARAEVPLCDRCGRQRRVGRAVRVVVGLVLSVAALILAALLLEVLLPIPEGANRRTVGMVVALILLAVAAGVTWVALRSALRRHRLGWDPVWPTARTSGALVFRDVETARAVVAASSGIVEDANYRESAAPPTPYQPKGDPLAWLVPVVLAVGACVALVSRWQDFSAHKKVSVTIVESLVFDIAGRWGLAAFWVVAIALLLGLAWMLRRERRVT